MLTDDLPEGITAERTATVTMTVEYVYPLTEDGRLDVFGRTLTQIQRLMEDEAFDVEATSLSWTPNRQCARGHTMPAEGFSRKHRKLGDDDCPTCIDLAVAQAERRAEGDW